VGAALVRIAAVAAGMARSGGSAPGASVSGRFEKTWRAPARRSRAQLRPRPGQARGGRKGEEALRAAGGDYRRVPEGAEILDGGGGGACGATRCRVWGVGRGVLAATDLEGRDEHVGAHVAERAGRDVVVDHGLQSLLGEGRAEGRVPPRGFRREDVLPHAPDRPPALSQCPPRLRSRTACTAQTPPSPRTKRAHEAPSCGTSRCRAARLASNCNPPPHALNAIRSISRYPSCMHRTALRGGAGRRAHPAASMSARSPPVEVPQMRSISSRNDGCARHNRSSSAADSSPRTPARRAPAPRRAGGGAGRGGTGRGRTAAVKGQDAERLGRTCEAHLPRGAGRGVRAGGGPRLGPAQRLREHSQARGGGLR